MESRKLIVEFNNAGRKGNPFTGWAGSVREWQENKAPRANFGTWHKDTDSERGCGSVSLDCAPYTLIMWGANSRAMRISDRTVTFAFAGLAADGNLWAAPLPPNTDARQIFLTGGWIPPTPESVAQQILDVQIDAEFPGKGKERIERITETAWIKLGIRRGQDIGELLPAWPHLEPIAAALQNKCKDWGRNVTIGYPHGGGERTARLQEHTVR